MFVPFTLAGEEIIADVATKRGRLVKLLKSAPERAEAICPHFGCCGGCALQHFDEAAAAKWKAGQVVSALERHGLKAPVHAVADFPGHGRRRAVLKARRTKKTIKLGFHARRSDAIIPVDVCPVLRPEIVALLPALAQMLNGGLTRRSEAAVSVLWTGEGADIAVEGGRGIDLRLQEYLGGWARQLALARLNWNGELIVRHEIPPFLEFGKARVTPPPGGFVQALEPAERLMSGYVSNWLEGAKNIVDLFCGCGTFALVMAQFAPVHGVDTDEPALAALAAGASQTPRLRPVSVERRNLLNTPLRADELARFDMAIFDPPRAGARVQCEQMANSGLARIAAISCNPVSFARDAAILVAGGFELVEVRPIDQFRFSPHIELAALFRRR